MRFSRLITPLLFMGLLFLCVSCAGDSNSETDTSSHETGSEVVTTSEGDGTTNSDATETGNPEADGTTEGENSETESSTEEGDGSSTADGSGAAPVSLEETSTDDNSGGKPPRPVATPAPNHAPWTTLLKKNVSAAGNVNYKGFKSDQTALNAYLTTLKATPPQSTWNRNEKLAYWINVYNAFTVDLVVRNYPVKSITDIGGPWDIKFIDIDGRTYSLSEIENKVIRPRFNEPRIHFAVNCASVSCPKLLNEAFEPKKLNSQLNKQTKAYINDTKENSISAEKAEISQIFEWYQEDFVKQGTLIAFLNKYSNTQINDDASMGYKEYNWNLNE